MNNKNKILLISLLSIVAIILIVFLFFLMRSKSAHTSSTQKISSSGAPTPIFMTDQEKAEFHVPSSVKAQVVSRDTSGDISVYKIIRSDADIVIDPNKVTPISPRQNNSSK
jgi:hypothetical protein